MSSSGFLSVQTPFTLLLWLFGLFFLAGMCFLLGRAVGFVVRIYNASDFLPRPYLRRMIEVFIGGMVCWGILGAIEENTGISIGKETPGAIFCGLVLMGFVAGYVHDHWVHNRHEQEKENQSEEGLSWGETCDCSVCERRRRQAARKG